MTSFTVACVQTNTGLEMEPAIAALRPMVMRARDMGADFITTPENVTLVDRSRKRMLTKVRTEAEHPAIPAFQEMARETGAWLLAGSLTIKLDEEHVANRSYLFDAQGSVVARYDKIHMFDVDLKGGDSYRESATVRSGGEAVIAPTPWGLLGMTVCYDLRFAALYRALAHAGASFLTVPAAFTAFTGKAHWHVLLRARAIETGCFVIAPAQVGTHEDGRETYGHSLVVAPWGEVLLDGGDQVGVTTAVIDTARVEEARGMVPALTHDRPFKAPRPATVDGKARAAGD
ncbi:MAG: carbon-nitrogen hydrolase family protein [Alphaproteobacteria bacterium]|nr:carbon-nitrogen hydrolase family protein [Alphaproteobacteria bacterium]